MMALKIYEYNRCGTCRKACKYLDEKGVAYDKVPIREQAPTVDELELMLGYMNGEIKKLFNTSGVDYKAGNYKDKVKNMTKDEAFAELSANGNLVKRPFVLGNGKGIVGFKEDVWDELF